MLSLKLTYETGSELLRQCKEYEIIFDSFDKPWSYMLITGRENIIRKLGKFMIDCYTLTTRKRNERPTKITFDLSEMEFLKAVFSLIDLREKPFLAGINQQFTINYDKIYENAEKEARRRQSHYPDHAEAETNQKNDYGNHAQINA